MAETVITEARVIDAWCKLFSGHGSRDDAAIVLGELSKVTGYYMVTTATDLAKVAAPGDVRAFNDGGRRVYLHLLSRIERDATATAVEREARLYRVK